MNILNQYIKSAPSPQKTLDIFKGEWSSKLPDTLATLEAGSALLFQDPRIEWCASQIGGFENKSVLELGPLEAGHTYMMESLGAQSIISIEANTRAYLKCLIVKELLELKRTRFLCGDFVEYLRTNKKRFDICIASGVLYHMLNPAELIALASNVSDQLFIWTHYYDHEIISSNPSFAYRLSKGKSSDYKGFRHMLYPQKYEAALNWKGFCGGNDTSSYWLKREDILACLKYFGFNEIMINFDHPQHPNGPSFALMAFRRNN
ncbi:MAG: class I SAM-dependent methyltransferase [Symploca sp. SIO2B6]|nr:class I SAM-dependent methyltransferase [Symploca sp. SIO2B6]